MLKVRAAGVVELPVGVLEGGRGGGEEVKCKEARALADALLALSSVPLFRCAWKNGR